MLAVVNAKYVFFNLKNVGVLTKLTIKTKQITKYLFIFSEFLRATVANDLTSSELLVKQPYVEGKYFKIVLYVSST